MGMNRVQRGWWMGVAALVCLGAGGCGSGGGGTGESTDHPLVEQAQILEGKRDIDGAIEYYEKALRLDPDLAKPHQKLAMHYDQYRNDPVRAIYHYQRYLELESNPKARGIVEELIEMASARVAASISEDAPAVVREVTRLTEENMALREDLDTARRQVRQLNALLQRARVGARTPGGEPPGTGSDPVPQAPSAPERYTVVSGDNLSRIAAKVYKDGGQWRRIYEENRDILTTPEDLKIGQILKIPPP